MIQVSHLSFRYTQKPFIRDMTFSVSEGEIFGFLGSSGAGKSTLQKILLGMLPSYQGSAKVSGRECKDHGPDFYESIGVDFEFSTLYEKLTARENLQFFSSLYRRQVRAIPELLAAVGLENGGDKRVSDYSKGMKSRLNFVKALLHDPALLFLDEPTSGLDPANCRLMKDMIREEKRRGKTIYEGHLAEFFHMLKLVRRDRMLLAAGLAPVLAGIAIRFSLPLGERSLVCVHCGGRGMGGGSVAETMGIIVILFFAWIVKTLFHVQIVLPANPPKSSRRLRSHDGEKEEAGNGSLW